MTNQLGQKMYGVTSKQTIKTWWCDVVSIGESTGDDIAILTIYTEAKLGGKVKKSEEVITEGKNIGKANETTPYEQAVSEAESRYRKKVKAGYKLKIPTDLTKTDMNALGLPKPMRAYALKDVKKVNFKPQAFVQPKLNGHRAVIARQNGKIMMYARGGDEITTMQHILDYMSPRVSEGQLVDGELYLHGKAIQDIGSLIKKYREGESEKVVFVVYDIIMDVPYIDRLRVISVMLNSMTQFNASNAPPAMLIESKRVTSLEEAIESRDYYISQGYEGGMLRVPDDGYEAGKKSRKLIKLKVVDDAEFLIVGIKEGKDRRVNDVVLKVAKFECEISPGGPRFDVTAMGDMYEKDRTYYNGKEFIGKLLTVGFAEYTKDGIPFHCVALQLREDI